MRLPLAAALALLACALPAEAQPSCGRRPSIGNVTSPHIRAAVLVEVAEVSEVAVMLPHWRATARTRKVLFGAPPPHPTYVFTAYAGGPASEPTEEIVLSSAGQESPKPQPGQLWVLYLSGAGERSYVDLRFPLEEAAAYDRRLLGWDLDRRTPAAPARRR
jgi:hypothetical protein